MCIDADYSRANLYVRVTKFSVYMMWQPYAGCFRYRKTNKTQSLTHSTGTAIEKANTG